LLEQQVLVDGINEMNLSNETVTHLTTSCVEMLPSYVTTVKLNTNNRVI
jgi:hypothetical protein